MPKPIDEALPPEAIRIVALFCAATECNSGGGCHNYVSSERLQKFEKYIRTGEFK